MADFIEIPINSDLPSFTQRAVLAGKLYFLRFDWNIPDERWQMSIKDQANKSILDGLPMNAGEDMIGRFRVSLPDLPDGLFMLFDPSLQGKEAGRDDLGKNLFLLFRPND